MQKYSHILLVSMISMSFIGCAHNSQKMGILEKRANYNNEVLELTKIVRSSGKVKKAWLHRHEMPTGDYFGGAWVYLLIKKNEWNVGGNNE